MTLPSRIATPGHARHRRIGLHQDPELVVEADRERVLLVRGAVRVGDRRRVVELDRLLLRRGRGTRDLERLAGDAVRLVRARAIALELKPHAPLTRTRTPKPALDVRGRGLEGAVLDGQALVAALDDANVGVVGAKAVGGVEGAFDQFVHGVSDAAAWMALQATRPTGRPAASDRARVPGTTRLVRSSTVKTASIDCWSRVRMPPGRSIADRSPVGEPIARDRDRAAERIRRRSRSRPCRAPRPTRAVMRMSSTAIASAPALRSS